MRKQFKTEIEMSVSLWIIIVGLITFALLMSCNKKPIEVNPNVEMIKGLTNNVKYKHLLEVQEEIMSILNLDTCGDKIKK